MEGEKATFPGSANAVPEPGGFPRTLYPHPNLHAFTPLSRQGEGQGNTGERGRHAGRDVRWQIVRRVRVPELPAE